MKLNLKRIAVASTAVILISLLYVLASCSAVTPPPAAGSACTGNNGVSGVVGSDGNCWTCNSPDYAYYGYTVGYCGSENSAGVSCCSSTYNSGWNYGVVCSTPGLPYLCSNGLCYSGYQSGLTCVYDP